MARSRIGLDVGSTGVRAAELTVGGDRPTVVRVAQVPLPPGAVEDGEVRDPGAVAEAIRELWRRGGFKTRQVTMGVGNQRVIVREIVVPSLPEKELRQSLPFQVQELIPIPVEQAVLDFDTLDEFEQEGRKMVRLLVVAAQRQMIDEQLEAALQARLDPVGVDLVPFALVRAVGHDEGLGLEEAEGGGEAIVDVGADVTNICVHERGVPRFVRILPSAGRDVTRAVAEALAITEAEAEALKRGEAPSGEGDGDQVAGEPEGEAPQGAPESQAGPESEEAEADRGGEEAPEPTTPREPQPPEESPLPTEPVSPEEPSAEGEEGPPLFSRFGFGEEEAGPSEATPEPSSDEADAGPEPPEEPGAPPGFTDEGGAGPDPRELITERSAALVDEIRSSLEFYRAQTPGAEVSRILVTGGGAKLEGLLEQIEERIGVRAERGRAFDKVDVRLDLDEAALAEAEPLLAVAVGLALPQETPR